jgi:hypothetical protein
VGSCGSHVVQTLTQKLADKPIDLAAESNILM